MNKKEILDKIKSLDGLNNDEKAYLVNLVNTKKKYGLVWEDKPEDVEEELRTKLPVLKEVKERAIINDTETEKHPNHILIEGDNLHALTALTFTHEGKIDLIYIDPPYNTGNKDFKYNDTYIDSEDEFRHSKWLSFIEKRVVIAKKLLSDDGLIFISIDDNEYAQLKLLMDELFGNNFINSITLKTSETSGVKMNHTEKKLPKIKEYLLIYAKNKDNIILNPVKVNKVDDPDKFEKYAKYYSKIILNPHDDVREWKIIPISDYFKQNNLSLSKSETIDFKIRNADKVVYRTNNKTLAGLNFNTLTEKVISPTGIEYVWWEGKQMLFLKDYISEGLCDLWTDISTINLNKEICGLDSFENGQKPIELLNRVLSLISKKDFTVLDFFAGSGTTLHSIIEFNKSQKLNTMGIIITNNENGICENITYERNKRAICGYVDEDGKSIEGIINNNLRYFRTDFVDREPSLTNKRQLTKLATELLCIKEDCYQEITSQLANHKWHKFFTGAKGNYVYVVYDDMHIEEAVSLLTNFISTNKEAKIKVYVFSNGQYPYAEEFEDVANNITLAALPDAIYKAYQNVLPKQNKEFIPELEEESPEEFDKEIEA